MKKNEITLKTTLVLLSILSVMEVFLLSIHIVNKNTIYLVLLLSLVCISIFIIARFYSQKFDETKRSMIMKKILRMIFVVYIMILVYLVLFDESFGRTGLHFDYSDFDEYMENSFNIVPFVTIARYPIRYTSLSVFSTNILGNLLALAPISFFLPIISKKKINFQKICLVGVLGSLLIELLQLATLSGSFDIDDIILNSVGMVLMYLLLNIKIIKKGIVRITNINY